MTSVNLVLDFIIHLDAHLTQLVEELGLWVYAALFATVFAETGLVIFPFLPGESLLVTSGTLAGAGILNIAILWPTLFVAAFLGDLCNYGIGRFLGRHILSRPRRWIKQEHVAAAHDFYERYGGRAIVFARFLPIVRTLAPFVAGAAGMSWHRMVLYAAVAAGLWVTLFVGAGYWFGTVPWVKDYLAFVLGAIALASLLPGIIAFIVRRLRTARSRARLM